MIEFLTDSNGSDIKVLILSPFKMCSAKHTLVWGMYHRDDVWYHKFALFLEKGCKHEGLIKAQESLKNRKYRYEYNPSHVNKNMRRVFQRILNKFDIDEDDLNRIRAEVKGFEKDVYLREFRKINN